MKTVKSLLAASILFSVLACSKEEPAPQAIANGTPVGPGAGAGIKEDIKLPAIKSTVVAKDAAQLAEGNIDAIRDVIDTQAKAAVSISMEERAQMMVELLNHKSFPSRESLREIIKLLGRTPQTIESMEAAAKMNRRPGELIPRDISVGLRETFKQMKVPKTTSKEELIAYESMKAFYDKAEQMPELYSLMDIAGDLILAKEKLTAPRAMNNDTPTMGLTDEERMKMQAAKMAAMKRAAEAKAMSETMPASRP